MLAKPRRMATDPERRRTERHRRTDCLVRPFRRMLGVAEHPDRLHMHILRQLLQAEHRHTGNVGLIAKRNPFGSRMLWRLRLDQLVKRFKMCDPLRQRIETRIGFEFRAADKSEEIAPVAIRIRQNTHISVACAKRFAPRADDADVTGRTKRRLERETEQMLDIGEFRRGLEHRHLDRLSAAAALTLKQRGHDRIGNRLARQFIAQHGRHERRLVARGSVERRKAGAGLNNIIIGGLVAVWTLFAKTVAPQ